MKQDFLAFNENALHLGFQRALPCPGVGFPSEWSLSTHDFMDFKPALTIGIVISILVDCQRQQFGLVILKLNFPSSFEFSGWKVTGSIKL